MRYLVVGATGLLGSHIAEELLQMGMPVRALIRNRHKALSLAAQGVELIRGDLADDQAVAAAVSGVDVIIYAADMAWLERMLPACRGARLQRIVVISCTDVYGHDLPSTPVDERYPLKPASPRQWALAKAEAIARAHAAELPITVLRSVPALGPRDQGFTREVIGLLRGPAGIPLVGGGRAGLSLIYPADLARAAIAAARDPATPGRTYVVQGFDTTWRQLLESLGRHLRLEPRFRSIPLTVARLTARWSSPAEQKWMQQISTPRLFDDRRFRMEVGWAPAWDLEQAAAATAAGWVAAEAGAPGA